MPARTPRVLPLGLLAAALTVATLTAPARASDPDPAVPPAAPPVEEASEVAQEALATVRELLGDTAAPVPAAGEHLDLTLALRDLALSKDDLPAAQERAAERLLARPTDGADDPFGDGYTVAEEDPVCSAVVCVHYVLEPAAPGNQTTDEVDPADGDTNGVPDYVEFARDTLTHVHEQYVEGQFRAPKSDEDAQNNGGDGRTDVYLADVGSKGFYGYCATDDFLPANQPQDTWAYCVLDNDYRKSEFPSNTPEQNLKVTAAHEYFHAVQFGYDVSEDAWIMEATATWAEDQIFDGVNDNVAYLRSGPMRLPHRSLDQFSGSFHYGTWIFFRYLTEIFRYRQGKMPILVRDLWNRLDDSGAGQGEYSLQGLKKVLRQRDMSLTEALAGFSAANRMPGRNYDEGKANRYPRAPLISATTLARGRRQAGPLRLSMDHMAAGTVRYRPGRDLGAPAWRLRLILDMKPRWKGSGAIVTIKPRSKPPRTKWVRLSRLGDARSMVNFSRSRTKWVEVTLVNASDHFRCNRGTRFSCAGQPKWDNSLERITAKLVKAG